MKTLLRNVFSNWAGLAANMAVAFFLSPFLVHSLGDSGYGLWVLVLSVTGYMGLLDTGLRVSVVKHTAEYNAKGDADGLNRILFTALSLYGSLSIVIVLLALVVSAWFPTFFAVAASEAPLGRALVVIAGINVALSLPLGVFGGMLSGLQRYDVVNRVNIAVLAVRTTAIVFAVWHGYRLLALGGIHIASQLFTGVLLLIMAKRQFPALDLRPRRVAWSAVRSLYSYSGFIVLNNIAMFLLFYSGEVVIGALLGTAAVTSYSIARSLVQYMSTAIGTMTQVFHPYASDLHERGDKAAVAEALLIGTKWSLLIALPIGLAYVIIGPKFIELWMGAQYGRSAGLLLILITLPQIVWLSQSAAGNILLGIGSHRFLTTLNLATGAVGIVTGALLVPVLGAAGVAAGMAVPIVVTQAWVLPVYTARALQVPLGRYLRVGYLAPMLAAVPFVLTLFTLSRIHPATDWPTLIGQVALSVLVFIPSVYFLAFDAAERERVMAQLRPARAAVNGAV